MREESGVRGFGGVGVVIFPIPVSNLKFFKLCNEEVSQRCIYTNSTEIQENDIDYF